MSLADQNPRVHPQGQLAACASPAQPGHQLVNEPGDAAGGVSRASAQPSVQHLAGVGPSGQQGVVAEPVSVAVAGALLVVATDLADGGVHIHGQRPVAGPGARRPRPGEDLAGHLVELTDVAEREAAQPGPNGGGRHHPVPEHAGGRPAAQQLYVVDAVPARDHGVDHGEQLRSWVGRARPVAEIDQLVGGLLDPQPLGERGGQQQPGRGDRVLVIERDIDLVQHHVRGSHRKGVLRLGDRDCLAAVILPGQGTLFLLPPLHAPYPSVDPGSDEPWPSGSRNSRRREALPLCRCPKAAGFPVALGYGNSVNHC
jgi:hypothetical protein